MDYKKVKRALAGEPPIWWIAIVAVIAWIVAGNIIGGLVAAAICYGLVMLYKQQTLTVDEVQEMIAVPDAELEKGANQAFGLSADETWERAADGFVYYNFIKFSTLIVNRLCVGKRKNPETGKVGYWGYATDRYQSTACKFYERELLIYGVQFDSKTGKNRNEIIERIPIDQIAGFEYAQIDEIPSVPQDNVKHYGKYYRVIGVNTYDGKDHYMPFTRIIDGGANGIIKMLSQKLEEARQM